MKGREVTERPGKLRARRTASSWTWQFSVDVAPLELAELDIYGSNVSTAKLQRALAVAPAEHMARERDDWGLRADENRVDAVILQVFPGPPEDGEAHEESEHQGNEGRSEDLPGKRPPGQLEPLLERGRELPGALESCLRVLLDRFQDDPIKRSQMGMTAAHAVLARSPGLLLLVEPPHNLGVSGVEGLPTGGDFVKNHPERVQVAPGIDLPLPPLRRHVRESACDAGTTLDGRLVLGSFPCRDDLRDTEVDDRDVPAVLDPLKEDVLGFKVQVHKRRLVLGPFVSGDQRFGDLSNHFDHIVQAEVLLDHVLVQRPAREILHDQVGNVFLRAALLDLLLAVIEYPDDVRMVEPTHAHGFLVKRPAPCGGRRISGSQYLDPHFHAQDAVFTEEERSKRPVAPAFQHAPASP